MLKVQFKVLKEQQDLKVHRELKERKVLLQVLKELRVHKEL